VPPSTLASPYLTRTDAAAYLGVATKTVDRLVSRGDLTAYRLSARLIRFRRDDLDALLVPTDAGAR
jgi:excisionase family DNA binding protein